MEWAEVKEEYVTSGKSVARLAEELGIDKKELEDLAQREGWKALRKQYRRYGGGEEYRLFRLRAVAERLLEKLDESIKTMDPNDLKVYKQLTGSLKDIKEIMSIGADTSEASPRPEVTADVVVRVEGGGDWAR